MNRYKIRYFILVASLLFLPLKIDAKRPFWKEKFRGGVLNEKNWCHIPKGISQWDRHMSSDKDLYKFKKGTLSLSTKVDENGTIKTAGIHTKGKMSFLYGRIEIRAYIRNAQGIWPAIWMKPVDNIKTPLGGELDIMEHLNYDDFVYQTIHSEYTQNKKDHQRKNSIKTSIIQNSFNVFAIEHHKEYIAYYINGEETFRYNKQSTDTNYEWPFDREYYLLIDMQAGGDWAGDVTFSDLPTSMTIDWVKYYKTNN